MHCNHTVTVYYIYDIAAPSDGDLKDLDVTLLFRSDRTPIVHIKVYVKIIIAY